MKTTRAEVYKVIDGERAYQDSKWNESTCESAGVHNPTEWLVYMENYLLEAKHIVSRESDQTAFPKALANIRKIAAMAVACMEQNGAPERVVVSGVKVWSQKDINSK